MGLKCALRCTPLERALIRERAAGHRMSVSAFLVACALNDDGDGASPEAPRLAPTGEEERLLFERVEALDRLCDGLYERLPGADISVFGAIAFIERALRNRAPGG